MATRPAGSSSFLALALAALALFAGDCAAQLAPWLDGGWANRQKVTVRSEKIANGAALADFPVLLDGAVLSTALAGAKSDGSDLAFTRRDGRTRLAHEVVSIDKAGGKIELWVRLDSLSTSARDFYVYFGNPTPPVPPSGSVWHDDYVAVYHFEEDPSLGVLADYTAGAHHARSNQAGSNWTSGDRTTGKIGRGWAFNGTTHYINTNLISTVDETFTVSAWLLHDSRSTDFFFQSNPGFWQLASQASENSHHAQYKGRDAGGVARDVRFHPVPIALGGFHHFAFVLDAASGKVRFHYDGVLQATYTFWPPDTNQDDYYDGQAVNPDGPAGSDLVGILGPMFHNPLDLMNGKGDEFRLHERALPTTWIATEFANQDDPAAFFTVGAAETETSTPAESVSRLKAAYR